LESGECAAKRAALPNPTVRPESMPSVEITSYSNRLSFVRITEGLTLKMKPTMTPLKVERDLSKLVNLRTGRKIISDARTATYVILSHGSGPGGRRFKSFRPDH
jgi:hypothetical protein